MHYSYIAYITPLYYATYTEVETTWPIIDEVRRKPPSEELEIEEEEEGEEAAEQNRLDIETIERFCRQSIIFTTDISFTFRLINNSSSSSRSRKANKSGDFMTDLAAAMTSAAPKAAINIEAPALHSISASWANRSSVHSFYADEFMAAFTNVHDKENTKVYDVLRTFREASGVPKTAETNISVAELMQDPRKEKKIESYFRLLYKKLDPPQRLSLPGHIKPQERKWALINRILPMFGRFGRGYLDTDRAVYKLVHGFHIDSKPRLPLQYPYAFEIIAIPLSDEILRTPPEGTNRSSTLITGVNYSVSPKNNRFEGGYEWFDKEEEYTRKADDLQDVLERNGFLFEEASGSLFRLPSVIAANVISPRLDYKGKSKADIDTKPFFNTIVYTAVRLSKEIPTFRGAGFHFIRNRKLASYQKPTKQKRNVADIIEEVLRERKEAMGV